MSITVPRTSVPSVPFAESFAYGRPVRAEQPVSLAYAFAHLLAIRATRRVHNIVQYEVSPLTTSPFGKEQQVATRWTLGPLAARLFVAVQYVAARPKDEDFAGSITATLIRVSDLAVIGLGDLPVYRSGEHGDAVFEWDDSFINFPIDLAGYENDKVELRIETEDVAILAVDAWEIPPREVG